MLSPNSCLKCVFLITNSSALGALGHTNQGLSNRGLNEPALAQVRVNRGSLLLSQPLGAVVLLVRISSIQLRSAF